MQAVARNLLRRTSRHYAACQKLSTVAKLKVPKKQLGLVQGVGAVVGASLIGSMCYCQNTSSVSSAQLAEQYYLDSEYDRTKLLEFLKQVYERENDNVEVMWRLARAAYDVANLAATPAEQKKELTYYARDLIHRTIELADDNFAVHKWFGIITSSIGDFEGSKVSIANSYVVKEHWLKATELNPSDATSHHLLGRWSLTIADISWIERKIAAAIFGSPPSATYEEALGHFMHAESLSPGFWLKNNLMIAQCYLKMKKQDEAKEWLLKAQQIQVKTEEDQEAFKEVESLLKSIK